MWRAQTHVEKDGRLHRLLLADESGPLSYSTVIELWLHDPAFCDYFTSLLSQTPFDAYFWETPPINRSTVGRGFEMVLADSPALSRVSADAGAFAEHFNSTDAVVSFPNLGGDAWLVAPCPRDPAGYPHLAAFSRSATAEQQRAFWRAVGQTAEALLSDRNLWISTSGLGIYWLHARLDSYPKYYTYQPYRK